MTDKELDYPAALVLKSGDKNATVKRVQEWLCLHGYRTGIDREYGPSTELQVNAFRKAAGLPQNGQVDAALFAALTAPMARALADIPAGGKNLRALVVSYAKQHLKEHPVEIGGENAGPWVRLYCMGSDGADYLWCAGFATFIVQQAAQTLGVALPITRTLSCDTLAIRAEQAGRFVKGTNKPPVGIAAGDLFLIRKSATDWIHTGIVAGLNQTTFATYEGNTNDDGSANGYEACARNRAYSSKVDFIKIA